MVAKTVGSQQRCPLNPLSCPTCAAKKTRPSPQCQRLQTNLQPIATKGEKANSPNGQPSSDSDKKFRPMAALPVHCQHANTGLRESNFAFSLRQRRNSGSSATSNRRPRRTPNLAITDPPAAQHFDYLRKPSSSRYRTVPATRMLLPNKGKAEGTDRKRDELKQLPANNSSHSRI